MYLIDESEYMNLKDFNVPNGPPPPQDDDDDGPPPPPPPATGGKPDEDFDRDMADLANIIDLDQYVPVKFENVSPADYANNRDFIDDSVNRAAENLVENRD